MASETPLSPADRTRLAAYREANDLTDLLALTGADSIHDAYFEAKTEWAELRSRELTEDAFGGEVPGSVVTVDGHRFHVHGITHADTDAEREFLREHVSRWITSGATVYTEQGIRLMYFADLPEVCEMDDYRWAMQECSRRGLDSHIDDPADVRFTGVLEEVRELGSQFRNAAFELIEAGSDRYGREFAAALGDVASTFLTSHAELATGAEFEAFRLRRVAAADPTQLAALQAYYERTFLPQPLEREWLRSHDPELELVTHARNERMVDYALAHNDSATNVHLIVGAAHHPGVRYYLERVRDGDRPADGYEPIVERQ